MSLKIYLAKGETNENKMDNFNSRGKKDGCGGRDKE